MNLFRRTSSHALRKKTEQMASFGLEGPGLNSGQRGKRQTAGPSALGAPAAKRARRPERAGAFADGDAAPGAPPPRPRLGKTKVGRPAAGERRDFGLNLPATASRDAYRNAVGAFPGMAAHRRPGAPPPLRRRDGPSVGDLLEGPRPVAPSRDEGRWVRGAFTGAPPPRAPKPKAKKLSGFMLFSKEMRPNIIAADPNLPFGDVSKCLGELWRGLPDAEKARYNRTCVPA